MKRVIIVLLLLSMLQLSACKSKEQVEICETNEKLNELFTTQQPQKRSMGQFSYGLRVNSNERVSYEYNGDEIHLPFFVEGMDREVISDFGLILFVNGVPHSYKIVGENEESEEAFMHNFTLGYEERKEFDIVFCPKSGKKGERISCLTATILKPDYLPETIERPSFGNYLRLSANIPIEIKLNAEVEECYEEDCSLKEQDIPKEILKKNENIHHNDTLDSIDTCPKLSIYNLEDRESEIILKDKNRVNLGVEIYGGADVSQRITFYVNNKLVKVNGKDYIKVKMQKGKMYVGSVELELEDYQDMNSIYAITMTDGVDYYVQSIFESRVKLLVEG